MNLNEIVDLQASFDKRHYGNRPFYVDISKDNLGDLEHLIVCLLGELGEFSNILKKVVRGDFEYDIAKPLLHDEMADIFIYLIKISSQSGIDLETVFLEKLKKNERKFAHLAVS